MSVGTGDVVIEGEAKGADTLCAEVARDMGASVEPHPAKWGLYGRAAGMIRNSEMLESGVDVLVSFPGGRGTRHCTSKATEMGIPVVYARMFVETDAGVPDNPSGDESRPSPDSSHNLIMSDSHPEPTDDPWEALVNPKT